MPAYDPELLETRLSWMAAGGAWFDSQLALLSDEDLAGPSRLPGWTRGHVASHLARNADALVNLCDWARTGVEHPMYESPSHRAQAIATGSARPGSEIRADALLRADALSAELSAMTVRDWSAEVRTARDRPIPAAEIPWMRVREVWVHGVDLAAGGGFFDLPADVARALAVDAVSWFSGRDDAPGVSIGLDGSAERLSFGSAEPLQVHGTPQAAAAWLLRGDTSGIVASGPLPKLPPWL